MKTQVNKTSADTTKEKILTIFKSVISLHTLKLALNTSMCVSDNEQGIKKLCPKKVKHKNQLTREGYFFMFRRLQNNVTYSFYKQQFYMQHQAEI